MQSGPEPGTGEIRELSGKQRMKRLTQLVSSGG